MFAKTMCIKDIINMDRYNYKKNLKKMSSNFPSELNYMKLKTELSNYIRTDKDSLLVFKSRNERWLEKEYLGLVDDKTSNFSTVYPLFMFGCPCALRIEPQVLRHCHDDK